MHKTKKIDALIHLLDDPDEIIFGQIRKELTFFGMDIVPRITAYQLVQPVSLLFQNRAEKLINEMEYGRLINNFLNWWIRDDPDLLTGVTLISNLKFPELNNDELYAIIFKYTQEIWLELNDRLTALEKVTLINHFILMYMALGYLMSRIFVLIIPHSRILSTLKKDADYLFQFFIYSLQGNFNSPSMESTFLGVLYLPISTHTNYLVPSKIHPFYFI